MLQSLVAGRPASSAYHASAVHFDGSASLSCSALAVTNTGFVLTVQWFKRSGTGDFSVIWVADPNGTYSNYLEIDSGNNPFCQFLSVADGTNKLYTFDMPAGDTDWHCFMGATDLASQKMLTYIDNTKVGDFRVDPADGSPLVATLNGFKFSVGDDGFGDAYVGDFADWFLFVLGSSPLNGDGSDLPLMTRRLFVDADGKPVNPATAITALGTPAVLFSGNAAAFATNRGTGGAFTLTGVLTNASTSPSD
jgi:hypothetical protein